MKLLVEELITDLEQTFVINDGKIHHIRGVRPYLYCHNNPSGTFTMQLKSGVNTLAQASFTANDLYNALLTTDDFIHLFYKLDFGYVLPLKNGTYKLKLLSSGYTFSSNSFLGWVKEFEDLKNPVNGMPTDDANNPLSFELWEFGK